MIARKRVATIVCSLLAFGAVSIHFSSATAQALEQIPWVANVQQAQQLARARNRLVLIHFWGDNCPPCDRMEEQVFTQPEVARAIGINYVPVKVNVHRSPELKNHFKITSWPTDVIITPEGKEIRRAIGFRKPDQYIALADGTAVTWRVNAGQSQATIASADPKDVIMDETVAANQFETVQYKEDASRDSSANPQYRPGASQYDAAASRYQVSPGQRYEPENDVAASSSSPARQPVEQTNPYVGREPRVVSAQGSYTPNSRFNAADSTVAEPSAQGGFSPVDPAASAGAARSPQSPPPLAIDGFCPVTLSQGKQWRKGDRQFGAIHRGRTYLFIGQAEQQQFLQSPDRFSPVLSGCDVVKFVERGQFVDGRREFGVFLGEPPHIFLFADKKSRDAFERSPKQYAVPAWQAMQDAGATTGQ